eukprot:PITA_21883
MKNQEMTGRLPLFDRTNFGFWKKRMSYYLMSLGLEVWNTVLNGYTAPPTIPTYQYERKAYIANTKALNSITSGITYSEFTEVLNCDSTKEVWDKLVSLYDGDSKVEKAKLQTHRRQFQSLKMDDEEDIASNFLRVAEVVNSLKGLGENIEESTVVQKVLRSLPDIFDSKVSAIKEMKELDTLKMDQFHGILINYEMRKGIPSSKDATFKASKSKKGKGWNTSSDDSDVESELVQFVRRLKKGAKLKDEFDEDEYVVIKKKSFKDIFHHKESNDESDEENDYAGSKEVLFMAFTEDDEPRQENEEDTNELLTSTIEENEELQKKVISLKMDKEEAKRREDIIGERHEAEIVSLKKEMEQIKRILQSSQTLDHILNTQKSQSEKSRIGFKEESSSAKDNARSYADVLCNNPKGEKSSHQRLNTNPKN